MKGLLIISLILNVGIGFGILTMLSSVRVSHQSDRNVRSLATSISESQSSHAKETKESDADSLDFSPMDDVEKVMDRLRGAGAPRHVIYAIVSALVHEEIAFKRAELLFPVGVPYWRLPSETDPVIRQQLDALMQEERRKVHAYVGAPENSAEFADLRQAERRRKYDGIPAEKAELLGRKAAVVEELLTPQELFEYNVRNSKMANRMRNALGNLELSENEFRDLFRIQSRYEDQAPDVRLMGGDQNIASWIATREEQIAEIVRSLGYERGWDYVRRFDPDMAGTVAFTSAHGLGDSVGQEVWRIKLTADLRAQSIRTSAANAAEQGVALADLHAKTAARLQSVLGQPQFRQFEQHHSGAWLRRLAPAK